MSATRPTVQAARAALVVGGGILAGAAFTAVVRVALPRTLGPTQYGTYRLAESAAEVLLLLLSLGLDTTLRRDVAQRPDEAAHRLADVLRLRAVSGIVLLLVGVCAMWAWGIPPTLLGLVTAFAIAQLYASMANAHAAVLHAVGDAAWPSATAVALRATWAVTALLILRVAPVPALVALALVAMEVGRWFALRVRSARRHGVVSGGNLRAATVAAVASLPLFINYLAHSLYARLGTWVLGLRAPAEEIGWFATASNVAGIALLGMPLVTWVLLPAAARAGTQDATTRDALVVGAFRAALLLGVPGIGLLLLLADPLVRMVFGAQFLPAAAALQALAPTIGLAYLATIAAVSLIERGAERRVALVSVASLGLSLAVTMLLVRGGAPGDFALQAARAALITETLVTITMLALAWRPAWTAPLLRTVGGVLLALAVAASLRGATALGAAAPTVQALLLLPVIIATLVATRALRRDDVAFARSLFRRTSSRVVAS